MEGVEVAYQICHLYISAMTSHQSEILHSVIINDVKIEVINCNNESI